MNTISIKTVMDKITRHPLLKDIPFDTVLDYSIDFIRIVGIPLFFQEKVEKIEIKEWRGLLPCDFYEIIQVRMLNKGQFPDGVNPAFRYSTDSFHYSDRKPLATDPTYKIQGNCIFTSIKEGTIEIAYRAIQLDDDGYPVIPDDSIFTRALEAYIKLQWFTIQFDMGKINQAIMQKAEQDYSWYVGQCQNSLRVPTIDQMESLSNVWNTLFIRSTEQPRGFLHSGAKELIKVH